MEAAAAALVRRPWPLQSSTDLCLLQHNQQNPCLQPGVAGIRRSIGEMRCCKDGVCPGRSRIFGSRPALAHLSRDFRHSQAPRPRPPGPFGGFLSPFSGWNTAAVAYHSAAPLEGTGDNIIHPPARRCRGPVFWLLQPRNKALNSNHFCLLSPTTSTTLKPDCWLDPCGLNARMTNPPLTLPHLHHPLVCWPAAACGMDGLRTGRNIGFAGSVNSGRHARFGPAERLR